MGIWGFGDLGIWGFGDLGIWGFYDAEHLAVIRSSYESVNFQENFIKNIAINLFFKLLRKVKGLADSKVKCNTLDFNG